MNLIKDAVQVAADAIEEADVSDMPEGTDLYTLFARAAITRLCWQPGLLRALADEPNRRRRELA